MHLRAINWTAMRVSNFFRCNSVKAVCLFLQWAHETGIVDTQELEQKYRLPTGSESRWMKRLKDGTLLTLKPYG